MFVKYFCNRNPKMRTNFGSCKLLELAGSLPLKQGSAIFLVPRTGLKLNIFVNNLDRNSHFVVSRSKQLGHRLVISQLQET